MTPHIQVDDELEARSGRACEVRVKTSVAPLMVSCSCAFGWAQNDARMVAAMAQAGTRAVQPRGYICLIESMINL